MAQKSRLEIIIDSRTAKQSADQLRASLDALTAAGTKAATSAGTFGSAATAAAAQIARLNAAATAGAGSNNRFGSSAAAAAAEVARLNASTAAGAGNNARFGAAATAAAAAVAALKAQSAASTAAIVRMGAASEAATAAIVRLDRANGSAIISSRSLATSSSALGGAIGGIGVALAAKEILSLTDRYKTLQGQLALVSSSNSEASQTFETLRTMSNNTGSSLEATVKLYTRFSNATRGAGFSQDQLLKATDAVNKAFLVSSATTQEATAASVQLSQAMASGTLRGEELNSVMEQAPRITRALSEYLGVATGQIRAMAAEGKITSDIVMNALLKSLSSLNEEVATMPLRFEQAAQALKNNFLAVIGQVNVDPVIDSVKTLADTLADPKASEGIKSISSALVSLVSVGADGLNGVLSNVDALIAITGAYATKVGIGLASSLALSVKARYASITATQAQIVVERQAEVASTAAAAQASRRVVAEEAAALAISQRSLAEAFATRSSQANALIQIQAVQARLVADRTLEAQQLRSQTTEAGQRQSLARLAEIRRAEAIFTVQQTAARTALGQATGAEIIAQSGVTAANARLVTARNADTLAMNAQNAAQLRLNAAQGAGARFGSALLGLAGGPMGAVTLGLTVLAGAAIYFASSTDKATTALIDQHLALDETVEKFDQLTAAQQRNQSSKWVEAQKVALDEASTAAAKYANVARSAVGTGRLEDLNSMLREVEQGKKTLDQVTEWLISTASLSGRFKTNLEELAAGYDSNTQSAAELAEKLAGVATHSQVAAQSTDALKFAQRESAKAAGASAATWDKYIEGLTKTRDLVGANAAAVAAYTAKQMGANPAQKEQARRITEQTDLLEKYQDAVKTRNTVEMESLRVQLVASYTAIQAAEDLAAAKKKADDAAANSAEESARRQREALQSVVNAGLRKSFPSLFQDQQDVQGYPLITNGKVAPVETVVPRKTPQQLAAEAMGQIDASAKPNKGAKGSSGQSALNAAMSTFDALYKKAEPAADAVRTLTKTQEQLELAQTKGKITQEQYGVAMAQASKDYAAVIAKTGELTQAEQYRLQIQKQLKNQQDIANQTAAAVGQGSEEASRASERLKLESDNNDRILDLRTKLARASTDAQRKDLQDQIDITNELFPQQVKIMEDGWAKVDAAQGDWENGAKGALQDYSENASKIASQTRAAFTSLYDGMTDAAVDWAFGADESFGDVAVSFAKMIAKMELQAAASSVFSGVAGSGISGLLSGLLGGGSASLGSTAAGYSSTYIKYAKGGVHDSPSLSAYSNEVHDSPKVFAFAKGAGVFAEAGPEAIMPLTRDSSGNLGVRAQGGGSAPGNGVTNITVNVAKDGTTSVEADTRFGVDAAQSLKKAMIAVYKEQEAKSASFGGAIYKAGKGRS